MHEHSLDRDRAARRVRRTARLAAVAILALGAAAATSANAQLPGAPVLQNAWASPGLVGALDVGGGPDGTVYAAAGAWTPGSGRFQFSAGAGAQRQSGAGSRGVYGARVAIPLGGASSMFGFAAFAGIGGGSGGSASTADSTASTLEVPVGAAIGWRHVIGATHGISLYGTPSYIYYSGGSKNEGLVRFALGADVGITQAIGATLGIEFGGTRARGLGGPSGSLYGLGISYAFGHR